VEEQAGGGKVARKASQQGGGKSGVSLKIKELRGLVGSSVRKVGVADPAAAARAAKAGEGVAATAAATTAVASGGGLHHAVEKRPIMGGGRRGSSKRPLFKGTSSKAAVAATSANTGQQAEGPHATAVGGARKGSRSPDSVGPDAEAAFSSRESSFVDAVAAEGVGGKARKL
jgi:hypothetical protein